MILKKLEIRKFGIINNKNIEFSPGTNIICWKDESEKNAVFLFLKYMLYGLEDENPKKSSEELLEDDTETKWKAEGTICFEEQGKSYCFTRKQAQNTEIRELFCEDDQKSREMTEEEWSQFLGGTSAQVYENYASVLPPKSMVRQDLAKEIQNYMIRFLNTADISMNLGRAGQMLKMWRKGYQSQKSRHNKETEKEKAELTSRLNELEKELDELNQKKSRIVEEKSTMETAFGKDGAEEQLEIQLQNIQRRNLGMVIAAVLAVVIGLIGVVGWFQVSDQMSKAAMGICMVAAVIVVIYTFTVRRKLQMELSRKKKEKVRLRAQQQKLKWNQENVDETYLEKMTEFRNLQEEYQKYEADSALPTSEDMEIQALNLAMDTIEELSGNIRRQTGRKIKVQGSRILKELTEGKYGDIFIDQDLNTGVNVHGQDILLEHLPVKTLELIYFAVHMAAKELLCGKDNLWVVLDDTFCDYEEECLVSILGWLCKETGNPEDKRSEDKSNVHSEECQEKLQESLRQVILICSGKREAEILEKENIKYTKIRL